MKRAGLCFVVLLASVGEAQEGARICGNAHTLITGRVSDAQNGAPIRSGAVALTDSGRIACYALPDSLGRFALRGVHPGEYLLSTSKWGYRAYRPITLRIRSSDTLDVSIRLRPGSHFDDCLDAPSCAAWLQPRNVPGAAEEDQFEVAAYRTAAIFTWTELEKPLEHYFCVDASSAVIDGFRQLYPNVAPRRDCELVPATGSRTARLRHRATGMAAYALSLKSVSAKRSDLRTAHLDFFAGPLWGQWWWCEFVRDGRGWRPTRCELRGVA